MPVKEWVGVLGTFDLGTKSVYSSLCELLEHFQEELQKLPEICKDVHLCFIEIRYILHLGVYVAVFQGEKVIEGMSLPPSELVK